MGLVIPDEFLQAAHVNDGKTQQEIADFIGCSPRKVASWCMHGDPGKLDSLIDGRMKGNHLKQPISILIYCWRLQRKILKSWAMNLEHGQLKDWQPI